MSTNNTTFTRTFLSFFQKEAGSGIVLIICTIIALIWANSPLADYYHNLWQTYVMVGFGDATINKPFLLWINDGLMAIFFFVVGLEIKRELLNGELSSRRKATLPIAAAIGGAVVPAAIYVGLNAGGDAIDGWGIPMATDIAFALGVLALLGSRAPVALKIFVTALAIVDDLLAVLVIALFYTETISLTSLAVGSVIMAAAMIANKAGVRRTAVYVLLGIAIWVAFLKSGVHATVAGVLFAMAIPARTRMEKSAFLSRSTELIDTLKQTDGEQKASRKVIHHLEVATRDAQPPLQRMEHALHGWVAYGIMPIFALANAGVALSGSAMGSMMGESMFWGIALGLFLGKPLGIFAVTWLAIKAKIAELPEGISWGHILGAGVLAGIGFTMALFIANLAFADAALLETAKLAILVASLVSGLVGWLLLSRFEAVGDADEEVMVSDMIQS